LRACQTRHFLSLEALLVKCTSNAFGMRYRSQ
jgi:hypothetical protein